MASLWLEFKLPVVLHLLPWCVCVCVWDVIYADCVPFGVFGGGTFPFQRCIINCWVSVLFTTPYLIPSTPSHLYLWISDMHAQIISSIKDLQLDGEDPRKLLQSWGRLRFPRHLLQWVGPERHRKCWPLTLVSYLIANDILFLAKLRVDLNCKSQIYSECSWTRAALIGPPNMFGTNLCPAAPGRRMQHLRALS